MKILIIEDEILLAEAILEYLSKEKYECELANNLLVAKQKSWDDEYDCIIVDINLPDGSGLDVITQIKEMRSKAGVIIVSARNSIDDKIKGLDIGADDYLTKPFNLAELNARIKSILRRKKFEGQNYIVFKEIILCPDEKWVKVNGSSLKLTKKEYELMLYFMSNINRVIPKDAIAEYLWKDIMGRTNSYDFIYSQLKNIRKKIEAKNGNNYIQTIYGLGYKFSDQ
ncbi:response regulator transcription factor [uncultured Tenacibaculum sp.]|uniref:response regulator transcription factor n=1 Tax=uncultured Tenacibaculum sp. TaxID=174713 RepID=UPI00261CC3C4|nr:response regulator transcription factor [uncultured Tenacibaculum sp.]